MDIVSFETAKRLKEAGFPQPEMQYGQVWHSKDRAYFLFYKNRVEVYFSPIDNQYGVRRLWIDEDGRHPFFDRLIFAPTATDILRLLPGHDFYFTGKYFYFSDDMEQGGENPAEVAAKKWLQ